MIASSQAQLKKFNLLHLEEGEAYVKEFLNVTVKQFDPTKWSQSTEFKQAKVHLGSRGLIVELAVNNESRASLIKYLFKNFTKDVVCSGESNLISITVNKLVEVPCGTQAAPQAYKVHNEEQSASGYILEMMMAITDGGDFHSSDSAFNQALTQLYQTFKSNVV